MSKTKPENRGVNEFTAAPRRETVKPGSIELLYKDESKVVYFISPSVYVKISRYEQIQQECTIEIEFDDQKTEPVFSTQQILFPEYAEIDQEKIKISYLTVHNLMNVVENQIVRPFNKKSSQKITTQQLFEIFNELRSGKQTKLNRRLNLILESAISNTELMNLMLNR